MSNRNRKGIAKRSGIAAIMLGIVTLTALSSCSTLPAPEVDRQATRNLNLEEFFDGQSQAKGVFRDPFGKVRNRFDVAITGNWNGETLTLIEDFTYEDGRTEQRIWTLDKLDDTRWQGTAPGVIGIASGEESENTFTWAYTIDLPVKSGTMRVSFDDKMWLLDDGRILNRAAMSRFGLPLGQVEIYFERGSSRH